MRRDTYHDWCTREAMADRSFIAVEDALWERSGASNVTSAKLDVQFDFKTQVTTYGVVFDASAWTGR